MTYATIDDREVVCCDWIGCGDVIPDGWTVWTCPDDRSHFCETSHHAAHHLPTSCGQLDEDTR